MHRWNVLIARGFGVQVAVFALVCSALLLAGPVLPQEASARNQQPPPQDDEGDDGYEDDDEDLLDLSSTGYIDNAIVGTRWRFRFDAASGSDAPDRAEFFYAKCGCFRNPALPLGALFDPSAPGPAPGTGSLPEADVDYQELTLDFEYGFRNNRFSLFAEIPGRSVELGDNGASFTGLGDIRVGAKIALVRAPGRHLTFQLRAYLPTGEANRGLGTDHSTLEPGLLYYQRLSGGWSFESELKYWMPSSGSAANGLTGGGSEFAGDILRYGIGVARRFERSSGLALSPVAELVGWSVQSGYKTAESAEGDSILNLKLGLRIQSGERGSWYVGYGFALSDDVWYDGIFRLEYRMNLSGLGRR